MTAIAASLALALALATPARCIAADDEASCERPRIKQLRYDEDYSFLRDPRCRTDLWDRFKYQPWNRDGSVYTTLGLDARERYEYFSTIDWAAPRSREHGYLLQRIMPHAAVHVGETFEVFVQLTSNVVWGRDPRPLDRDDLDVLQAFASLSLGSLTLRAGRQEIEYASSRLISIREGPNVRRAFDGVRIIERIGKWQFDGFGLVPVQVRPGIFDDPPTPGQWFWGFYGTGPVLGDSMGLDVYSLGLHLASSAYEQGTRREVRHTFGTRIWGKPSSFDYNVELAWQTGAFGAGAIAAWTLASDVGYRIEVLPTRPRIGTQANASSGDLSPRSSGLQTFNPLFPRGSYFSQANLIGPINFIDVHPGVTLAPIEALEVTLDWDFFWRQSLGDGLYAPSGALQIPGAGNPSRYIGSQGAVLVDWRITRHATLAGTYSHFFAGPFLRSAVLGNDVDFIGLWISYAI